MCVCVVQEGVLFFFRCVEVLYLEVHLFGRGWSFGSERVLIWEGYITHMLYSARSVLCWGALFGDISLWERVVLC